MFESDFPPAKSPLPLPASLSSPALPTSYQVLYNAFQTALPGLLACERAAMFHDTAAKIYRIDV